MGASEDEADDDREIVDALLKLKEQARRQPSGVGERLGRHLRAIEIAVGDPENEDRQDAIRELERFQDELDRSPTGPVYIGGTQPVAMQLANLLRRREADARAKLKRRDNLRWRVGFVLTAAAALFGLINLLRGLFGDTQPAPLQQPPAQIAPAVPAPAAPAPSQPAVEPPR